LDIVNRKGYRIPLSVDAATAILIMNLGHSYENGDYFFGKGEEKMYWTFTTAGKWNGWRFMIGAACPSGLTIIIGEDEREGIGVAGFAEVL
jgi:hypothetical protein